MKTNPNELISFHQQYGPVAGETETFELLDKGLTKREYFAALAMQGLMADPQFEETQSVIARAAVTMADKLIEALNRNDE
jgi:hypothetical protein